MTFLSTLTREAAAHADQPQHPTDGKPCHHDHDIASVGWVWTGSAWQPACGTHIQAQPCNRIFDSEYLEDE